MEWGWGEVFNKVVLTLLSLNETQKVSLKLFEILWFSQNKDMCFSDLHCIASLS